MNLPYELSKIKDSFRKVKDDMSYLSSKIASHYDEFMRSHRELSHKVEELSIELREKISHAKENNNKGLNDKELHDLRLEVKELRKELGELEKDHSSLTHKFNDKISSKDSKDIYDMKEKIHESELEIYLLKERMMEKDLEVKQLKDVNQRLFEIVDELAKLEQELVAK